MTEILGNKSEIRTAWKFKPELRVQIVRFVMKNCGRAGVKQLASVLKLTHREIYEIGGIEGWINKRKCQRRKRRNRQKNKLREYNLEVTYAKESVSTGGGKRGKGGGLQNVGRRANMQALNGQ